MTKSCTYKLFSVTFALMISLCLWQVRIVCSEPDTTGSRTMTNPWNMDLFDLYGGDYLQFDEMVSRISDATDTATANILSATAYVKSPTALFSAAAGIGGVTLPDVFTAQQEPTGFLNRTSSTISFATTTYTFTITGSHDIYIKGVKYTKPTASIQLTTDTTGLWFVYYDSSGTLTVSTTFPGFFVPLIASVYWNTTTDQYLLGDERHGITMDGATHEWMHDTVGVRYESGLTGTFTNTTFATTLGYIHDEDNDIAIAAQTKCNVLYKNGSADWVFDPTTTLYYKVNGSNLRYNNGNTLTDVSSNDYVAYWIFATNDPACPIISIMGQRTDGTITNARANNTYESLALGVLPYKEAKLLYRVILRNDATPYEEISDYRTSANSGLSGTVGALTHNSLSGLGWDQSGHNDSSFSVANGITSATRADIAASNLTATTIGNATVTNATVTNLIVTGTTTGISSVPADPIFNSVSTQVLNATGASTITNVSATNVSIARLADTGYIPLASSTTLIPSNIFQDKNGMVGINTTAPQALGHISSSAPISSGAQLLIDRYDGNGGNIILRSAAGTNVAPSTTTSGDVLGVVRACGFVNGAFTDRRVDMIFYPSENWTSTATGTHIIFRTTPIGSTTTSEALRITNTTLTATQDIYAGGNVSALSFTDRTEGFSGNALEEIRQIKNNPDGTIDHSTLGASAIVVPVTNEYTQVLTGEGEIISPFPGNLAEEEIEQIIYDPWAYSETVQDVTIREERSIGMEISRLNQAIKDLDALVSKLQARILVLESK